MILLMSETRPLAEVRQDLSKFVDEAVRTHARIDITRNGRRAAVLLSSDDFDSLLETLDILSNPELVQDIRDGLTDAENGTVVGHEEILSELANRRTANRQ